MRLHVHIRFGGEFGMLSENDIVEYFGGKAPEGRTSKKRKALAMQEVACEIGAESDLLLEEQQRKK